MHTAENFCSRGDFFSSKIRLWTSWDHPGEPENSEIVRAPEEQ
jgi:hypothetical protein